ncbi:unnamed protein product [Cunninghamella blakesleeana]
MNIRSTATSSTTTSNTTTESISEQSFSDIKANNLSDKHIIISLDDDDDDDDDDKAIQEINNESLASIDSETPLQQISHIETIDLDFDEDLDPELIKMAEQENVNKTSLYGPSDSSTPQKIEIKVQFVNLNETEDPNLKAFISVLCKPVKVHIMDNDRFESLLSSYCKKKRLVMENMVLVYDKIPVVLRATPSSLSMASGVTNIMNVYNKADYEKNIQMEQARKELLLSELSSESFDEGQNNDSLKSASETLEDDDDRFIIKLRGKDKKDVTLRVKPTTTMESIAKEYIRILKLDNRLMAKIVLSFEGEKLSFSTMISDTDLEDEDLVSVDII